jgi:hypothetical protein
MKDRPTNKELESMVQEVCGSDDYDCKTYIMDQIKSGRAKSRSRWLVLSEELGLRTTWILTVFSLIALINLFIYMLSRSPEWDFMEFGASGWGIIFEQFPYGWMGLAMGLIAFSLYAMKKFSWSYLFPFKLFSVLLISGIFMAGGVAFATGVNDTLYNKLIEEPGSGDSLLAKLYCLCSNRGLDSDNALMGEILYQQGDQLIVQTPSLDIVAVQANPENTQWLDETAPERFTLVKMLGERIDDITFIASHIKVHNAKGMELLRSQEDCANKNDWEHKREVADQRRQATLQPFTPSMGLVQMVQSFR